MTLPHLDSAALEKLEALAKAATPGPWDFSQEHDGYLITQTAHITRDVWVIPHCAGDPPFIAAANPAVVLGLVARIRELERGEP